MVTMKGKLLIKRVYLPASDDDGERCLVDRLWPRGLKKENAAIDGWLKDIAPSNEIRKDFNHEPEKFPAFRGEPQVSFRCQRRERKVALSTDEACCENR